MQCIRDETVWLAGLIAGGRGVDSDRARIQRPTPKRFSNFLYYPALRRGYLSNPKVLNLFVFFFFFIGVCGVCFCFGKKRGKKNLFKRARDEAHLVEREPFRGEIDE